ncbi:hypothetical protein NL460_29000, partial [Klebsiella pneumoniae]|nr:hypothetical protein [Klebsiella pneumoniae]
MAISETTLKDAMLML